MLEITYAAAALVSYVAISLVVGERFPFSRYVMYAALRERSEGAVLYVRAEGLFVAPEALREVFGLDVDALDPTRVPCSQQWIVYEVQRHLRNQAASERPRGAVPLELGYRIIRVDDDGSVRETLVPHTSGYGKVVS